MHTCIKFERIQFLDSESDLRLRSCFISEGSCSSWLSSNTRDETLERWLTSGGRARSWLPLRSTFVKRTMCSVKQTLERCCTTKECTCLHKVISVLTHVQCHTMCIAPHPLTKHQPLIFSPQINPLPLLVPCYFAAAPLPL